MDIVSFETAKALKGSGFPQPAPEFGQFWYSPNGARQVMHELNNPAAVADYFARKGHVFAPTATDLLRKLPCHQLDFGTYGEGEFVLCDGVYTISGHANPAEACAVAWLKSQECVGA
jgi:hypothetical protein